MSSFVASLFFKPTHDETIEISRLIDSIDNLKMRSSDFEESFWQNCFQKIAPYRLQCTANLKRGNVDSWIKANQWIAERSEIQSIPQWEDVLKLNQIIRESHGEVAVRDQEVYLGPWAACPAAELAIGSRNLEEIVFKSKSEHPLVQAALAQYWIVSLHPFLDGNGRTSILAADWILASAGYLPQTFQTKLDALIGHLPERKTKSDASRAVIKILKNIAFSYHLCFEN